MRRDGYATVVASVINFKGRSGNVCGRSNVEEEVGWEEIFIFFAIAALPAPRSRLVVTRGWMKLKAFVERAGASIALFYLIEIGSVWGLWGAECKHK